MSIFASQGVDADLLLSQINIGSDQAVAPDGTDVEGLSQDGDLAFGVGHAHEDHGALQRLLQVGSPVLGEAAACGCVFDANGVAFTVSRHEPR